MDEKNILINTAKVFEEGVSQINVLKQAIVGLNYSIKELTTFDDLLDSAINPQIVDKINEKLQVILQEQDRVLEKYKDAMYTLDRHQEKEIGDMNERFEAFSDGMQLLKSKYDDMAVLSEQADRIKQGIKSILDSIEQSKLSEKINASSKKLQKITSQYNQLNDVVKELNHFVQEAEVVVEKINNTEHINDVNKDLINLKETMQNALGYIKDEQSNVVNQAQKLNEIMSQMNKDNLLQEIKSVIKVEIENSVVKSLENKVEQLVEENKMLKSEIEAQNRIQNEYMEQIVEWIKMKSSINPLPYLDTNAPVHKPIQQPIEDIEELKRAAKDGDREACYRVGERYEMGIGVNQNIEMAIIYYRRGERLGCTKSASRILTIYMEQAQNGVEKYQKLLSRK